MGKKQKQDAVGPARQPSAIDRARAASAVIGCLTGEKHSVTLALEEAAEDANPHAIWNLLAVLSTDLAAAIVGRFDGDVQAATAAVRQVVIDERTEAESRGEA